MVGWRPVRRENVLEPPYPQGVELFIPTTKYFVEMEGDVCESREQKSF